MLVPVELDDDLDLTLGLVLASCAALIVRCILLKKIKTVPQGQSLFNMRSSHKIDCTVYINDVNEALLSASCLCGDGRRQDRCASTSLGRRVGLAVRFDAAFLRALANRIAAGTLDLYSVRAYIVIGLCFQSLVHLALRGIALRGLALRGLCQS